MRAKWREGSWQRKHWKYLQSPAAGEPRLPELPSRRPEDPDWIYSCSVIGSNSREKDPCEDMTLWG